jgi:hypothetical protein
MTLMAPARDCGGGFIAAITSCSGSVSLSKASFVRRGK